ncbi:MAG: hypothetical protein IJE97_02965, partial [Thermoguttaceae bacterium]|nr:hypothetical protein [Thermoguttaceae bacterium]
LKTLGFTGFAGCSGWNVGRFSVKVGADSPVCRAASLFWRKARELEKIRARALIFGGESGKIAARAENGAPDAAR